MPIKRLVYLSACLLFLFVFETEAQTTRDAKAPVVPPPQYQMNKKEKKESIFERWFAKSEQDEVKDFRKRMKQADKKRRKEERLALKPQYSDPTYFGHKKPPKKRPLGKRKYCDECGLRH